MVRIQKKPRASIFRKYIGRFIWSMLIKTDEYQNYFGAEREFIREIKSLRNELVRNLENKPKSITDIVNKYSSLKPVAEQEITFKCSRDRRGRFAKR